MKKNAAAIDVDDDDAPAARKPWRGVGLTLGMIVVVVLAVSLYRAKTEAQETRRHIATLEKELRALRGAPAAVAEPESCDACAAGELCCEVHRHG